MPWYLVRFQIVHTSLYLKQKCQVPLSGRVVVDESEKSFDHYGFLSGTTVIVACCIYRYCYWGVGADTPGREDHPIASCRRDLRREQKS